ncbi:MAG: MarR family transcriptional regulator, partial [Mesorhizobium sp.]
LTLTKAGLAAYREMVPLAKAFESQLLARLDLSDRSLILAAIAKLEAQF